MLLLAEHNRAFGYAAAASIALHALLLSVRAPLFHETQPAAPEPPLVARLVEPPPAAPAPPPPAPKAEPPKPAAKKETPPKRIATPKPKTETKPAPAPAPAEAAVREEAASEESVPAPAPPPAPAAPSALAAPSAPPAPDPAAALARFRHELVTLAVRYKRYPRVALDNGWSGNVVVRINVAASGAVAAIEVKTSSGHEILDAQALEMFRKALPEVTVPGALRGKDFSVEVRAIYNLKDRPG
jgi:protein TonB